MSRFAVAALLPPANVERLVCDLQDRLFREAGLASAQALPAFAAGAALRTGLDPRDFVSARFHRSTRLPDIYLTLVTGFDGTPMASFAKVMPPDDLWDVAMFVRSLVPLYIEQGGGLRCGQINANADELIGVRALLHSL